MTNTEKIALGLVGVALVGGIGYYYATKDKKQGNSNTNELPENNDYKPQITHKTQCQVSSGEWECFAKIDAPEFVMWKKHRQNQLKVMVRTYKNRKDKNAGFNGTSFIVGKRRNKETDNVYASSSIGVTDYDGQFRKINFEYKKTGSFQHEVRITSGGFAYKIIKI